MSALHDWLRVTVLTSTKDHESCAEPRLFGFVGRHVLRLLQVAALSACTLVVGSRATQNAIANGDTRSISIQHMHTKELTTVTFRRDGRYVGEALDKLNWALRDWRLDEPTKMDPRLFDIAWEVHREAGSSSPFHVVSAYRSPQTNSMLRRRSRGVAKHSQHTMGKAMDFYLPDVSPAQVRSIGMKMQRGGVGYYPSAYTPFIHLDVGSVRSWPRMTRDQLARLFPDGNTVHIAADGKPLEGYETAKALIIARGGSVGGFESGDFDEGAIMQGSRKSLWASLFGWNEEDESRPGRGRAGSRASSTLAYAPAPTAGDGSDRYGTEQVQVAAATAPDQRSALRGRRASAVQVAAVPKADEADIPARAAESAPLQTAAIVTPPINQPRFVQAPFPTARPVGLAPVQLASVQPGSTGQRLNWQQGPSGAQTDVAAQADVPASASGAALLRSVLAPLPPRRPDTVQVALAPALPGQSTADTPSASTGAAVLPRDLPGKLVTISHPLPPERPQGPFQRVAVAAPASASAPATASAPIRATPPIVAAPVTLPSTDRAALDNLFAAAATGALPTPLTRVTTARARAQQPQSGQVSVDTGPAAALGFTQREPNDTRSDRFSGPAVGPLPTTFTSR